MLWFPVQVLRDVFKKGDSWFRSGDLLYKAWPPILHRPGQMVNSNMLLWMDRGMHFSKSVQPKPMAFQLKAPVWPPGSNWPIHWKSALNSQSLQQPTASFLAFWAILLEWNSEILVRLSSFHSCIAISSLGTFCPEWFQMDMFSQWLRKTSPFPSSRYKLHLFRNILKSYT